MSKSIISGIWVWIRQVVWRLGFVPRRDGAEISPEERKETNGEVPPDRAFPIATVWCPDMETGSGGLSNKLELKTEESQVRIPEDEIVKSPLATSTQSSVTRKLDECTLEKSPDGGDETGTCREHCVLKHDDLVEMTEPGETGQIANVTVIPATVELSDAPDLDESDTDRVYTQPEGRDGGGVGTHAPTTVPRKIGGRRTNLREDPAKPRENFVVNTTPSPELVCRMRHGTWRWDIVLVVPLESSIAEVRHDETSLPVEEGEYQLTSYSGRLTVRFEDGSTKEISLFDGQPLIFKLRKDWKGIGRRLKGITQGYFVIFAPRQWSRIENAPIEAAGCTDRGFLAHCFIRDQDNHWSEIAGFRECSVLPTQAALELHGIRAFDNSEQGELFVGATPTLKTVAGVVWARVGEETKRGWAKNFKLAERSLEDVLNGRQGRFFIRVFNGESKLLDSDEFRYLRDFREIYVNGEPYTANTILVPPSTGHSPTELLFVGADDSTIQSIVATDGNHARTQPGSVVIVAPHPKGDEVSCVLSSGTSHIDTVIRLPRIWWRMESADGEFEEWRDTPQSMTRQEYRKYADVGMAIRLRLPPVISSVMVGFHEELDRVYSTKAHETEICMTDFVDYSQIDQRLNADASLNVQCSEVVMTLIRVTADLLPRIIYFISEPTTVIAGEKALLRWVTQNAESCGIAIAPGIGSVGSSGNIPVTPTETTTFTLRLTAFDMDDVKTSHTVAVRSRLGEKLCARLKRSNGGFRRGKGFSLSEIRTAGLTQYVAAGRSLPIDRRRRSMHLTNVDAILEVDIDA